VFIINRLFPTSDLAEATLWWDDLACVGGDHRAVDIAVLGVSLARFPDHQIVGLSVDELLHDGPVQRGHDFKRRDRSIVFEKNFHRSCSFPPLTGGATQDQVW
jgi:hypothetical protein